MNQDELGHVAEVIRESERAVVMRKKLADGTQVLALFNRDPDAEQSLEVAWTEIGLSGNHALRDLWRQKDLGVYPDGLSARVSADGCAILKVK